MIHSDPFPHDALHLEGKFLPLDPTEFRRLVRHGLGRAVLHLQQHDPAPYQQVILDTCLHNDVFDDQMNGRRAHYLWDLLQLSSNPQSVRDALIESLSRDDPDATDSFSCVPALIRRFAQQGDSEAREELHEALGRDPTSDSISDSIVRLDGLDGLLIVARQIGSIPGWDNELTEGDWAMQRAYERFGDQVVWEVLEEEAERDPHIEKFLVPWRKTRERPRTAERTEMTAEERRRRVRLKDPSVVPFQDVWSSVEEQIPTGRRRSRPRTSSA